MDANSTRPEANSTKAGNANSVGADAPFAAAVDESPQVVSGAAFPVWAIAVIAAVAALCLVLAIALCWMRSKGGKGSAAAKNDSPTPDFELEMQSARDSGVQRTQEYGKMPDFASGEAYDVVPSMTDDPTSAVYSKFENTNETTYDGVHAPL